MKITLDPHQETAATVGVQILNAHGNLVLNMDTRTGKTFSVFEIVRRMGYKHALFICPIKACAEIEVDAYPYFKDHFDCTFINPESLHRIKGKFDVVIYDEYHGYAYIQKKKVINKRFEIYRHLPRICLTGTLMPEKITTAYSLFDFEFTEYKNFYRWFDAYGLPGKKWAGRNQVNDYDHAINDKAIYERINKYVHTCTKAEAGFKFEAIDVPVYLDAPPLIQNLDRWVKQKRPFEIEEGFFTPDTPSKEFQGRLQLNSGCLKLDGENYQTIHTFKCQWIRNQFMHSKIAIYYNYIGEKNMVRDYFSERGFFITDDPIKFREQPDNAIFLSHFKSGREGIKLETAEAIIFFSCPHSYTSYHQARDRKSLRGMTSSPKIYILLSGLQIDVYKSVSVDKKNFNLAQYKAFASKNDYITKRMPF